MRHHAPRLILSLGESFRVKNSPLLQSAANVRRMVENEYAKLGTIQPLHGLSRIVPPDCARVPTCRLLMSTWRRRGVFMCDRP